MNKTIVSIISEQTIPNYLFIKEKFLPGDELMFIASQKMAERITWIKDVLKYNLCESVDIVFERNGDEEDWSEITHQIASRLTEKKHYVVNLTGGTKFMALAVQNVFSHYNSNFFYIPYPKNNIIWANELNQTVTSIERRVTVEEYTNLYNTHLRCQHQPHIDKGYTAEFFERFISSGKNAQALSPEDFKLLNLLRSYRNDKKLIVKDVEKIAKDEKHPVIEGLSDFLTKISYPYESGELSKEDVQYLTGGWFEEYVYHLIKERLNPTDIVLGPKTANTNNDLDVVFTIGNKLFVIECKTGVEGKGMLNEIVYKASALKENLLGLSARSYIFSLGQDNVEWSKAAKNMGIEYYGRNFFTEERILDSFISTIKRLL